MVWEHFRDLGSNEEMSKVTKIYSIAGMLPPGKPLIRVRPFRAPHHTVSHAGLVGGGRIPRPGEITLAHRGVLFLDELPEYTSQSLEAMRQPLKDRVVTTKCTQFKWIASACSQLACHSTFN